MSHTLSATGSASGTRSREQAFSEQLDPRSCLLSALLVTVTALTTERLDLLLIMTLVSALAVVILTRQSLATALRHILTVDGFIVFMLLLVPFQMPGPEAFSVFGFTATWTGLERAVQLGLRANIALLAMQAFICGLQPTRLGHALHQLRCPAKLVALLLFTVRYLDLLQKRFHTMNCALKARGFSAGCNLHSWKTLAWVYSTLLLRSIDQSERMHEAMRCRGFDGRWHVLTSQRIRPLDLYFLAGVVSFCTLFIGWELI